MSDHQTNEQLQQRVKQLEEILRFHGISDDHNELIKPQDIIDWLSEQDGAPHPLETSTDTMKRWLEAMDTDTSRPDIQRHIGSVMQLWREQGIPNTIFTIDQQDQWIAERGADMRSVVLTTTWQQYLLAREKKEEDVQSSAELDFSSIESIDTPPVEGIPRLGTGPFTSTRASIAVIGTKSPSVRGIRYVPGPFRYAAGPLPDLFPGYEKL